MENLEIPAFALVVAEGPEDAARRFLADAMPEAAVLSLAPYRIELSDDPRSPEARRSAFDLLRDDAMRRLRAGRSVAVLGEDLRDDQKTHLRKLAPRAFAPGLLVTPPDAHSRVRVRRTLPTTLRTGETGPFDIVGDVHGCIDELLDLLSSLGWEVGSIADGTGTPRFRLSHPAGRRLAFVGDLADRGPDPVSCLSLASDAVAADRAVWTIGNHDWKLQGWLEGRRASPNHGFSATAAAVDERGAAFRERLLSTLRSLPSHLVLDGGDLVVAHAGCLEEMQGKDSHYVTSFCMFGATTGETDADGLPVRADWCAGYRGRALVVHGHTPVPSPTRSARGNVLCVDTGCCFGGSLTAFRWPERELVAVPARERYATHRDIPVAGEPLSPT